MRKRLPACLCLGILITFLLSGCWNYREIENLGILLGIAVDKTEEGKFSVAAEMLEAEGAGTAIQMKSSIVETEGDTILDALRNAVSRNAPKLYLGHINCVIVSKEAASEGVLSILDFFSRDAEPRLSVEMLVSEGKSAKEVLEAKTPTSIIVSQEIIEMLKFQDELSKTISNKFYEFAKQLGGEGISPYAAAICIEEKGEEKYLKLCGTAVFKSDKCLGFINEEETKSFSFILDEVKGGVITLKGESESDNITFEILTSKTKLKPDYSNNKLFLQVDIITRVAIDEYPVKDGSLDEKTIRSLKKKAEEQMKKEAEELVKKVQKEFGSDIFGFGNTFYQKLPDIWREKGKEWDTLFKDLAVSVNPKIEIVHSGMMSEPIYAGD